MKLVDEILELLKKNKTIEDTFKDFIINVKPIIMKLKNNKRISKEEIGSLYQFYLEARSQLPGIRNFAENIKSIALKLKQGKSLTSSESNSFIQFYLEAVSQSR
jgi:hypothetical protein